MTPPSHGPHRCDQVADLAPGDRSRRLSSHATSLGAVVYYRCACGRPLVGLIARP